MDQPTEGVAEQLISPQELYARLSEPDPPLVIDVRDAEAYREGHIAGAVHIPGDELEGSLAYIPKGRPVVTY